jgi:hypothetical protein
VPADELGAEDLSSAVIPVMMAAQYWARQMVATSATLAITSMTAISAVEESIASDCVDRQPGRRDLCQCLRHQSMLATPEPGRSGSNPYGRPRISPFGPLRRFGRRILSTRPSVSSFADVTGDQFAVWQCAGEADQYQRSVSHVDGPVAKRSNDHRDHLCAGS